MKAHQWEKEKILPLLNEDVEKIIEGWVGQTIQELWQKNISFFESTAPQKEKKEFFQQYLEEGLKRVVEENFSSAIQEKLEKIGLWEESSGASLIREFKRLTYDWQISLPMKIEESPKTVSLNPQMAAVFSGLACFLGIVLGKQIDLAPLGALIATPWSVYFLLSFRAMVEKDPSWGKYLKFFLKISEIESGPIEEWKYSIKDLAQKYLQNLYLASTHIFCFLAREQMRSKENISSEDLEILSHFVQKCQDGFSEVYYCDKIREGSEERALDACITMMEDFRELGLEPQYCEKGSAYKKEMEKNFNNLGRVEEGDPIMVIYPAWTYKGNLVSPGKVKKVRD